MLRYKNSLLERILLEKGKPVCLSGANQSRHATANVTQTLLSLIVH